MVAESVLAQSFAIHLKVNQLMPHDYVWEYVPPQLHIWQQSYSVTHWPVE